MLKTTIYLWQGLHLKQALARLGGTLNCLTVNPQVPGSSPGRGAKFQALKPQKCGFFVSAVWQIFGMPKMVS
jgi:hypothetical protein